MDDLLQQGIAAVKAGDKERAYGLLSRAAQKSDCAEQAWVWLSAVVGQDAERLYCLENALHANPDNAAARRGADLLRQKGIFPAVPLGPAAGPVVQPVAPQAQAAPAVPFRAAAPRATTNQPLRPAAPAAVPDPARAQQQAARDLVNYIAGELAHRTPRKLIVKSLVDRGMPPEAAASALKETEQILRKLRRAKAVKRIKRGLVLTAIGVGVTLLTQLFSRQLGGYYLLFWGPIVVGAIDLLVGVFNWLAEV